MKKKTQRPAPMADLFSDAVNQANPSPPARPGTSSQQPLTPSSLNRMARQAMEQQIGRIWLSGEVSGFTRHRASGHCYFSLKDSQASIACVWFRHQIRPGQTIQDGDQVLILGQVSIYEPRGTFQVVVHHLEMAGQGDLHQQFLQLKKRLGSLGLFDAQFKKPLPARPHRIAIVTSRSGAAVQDVLKTIARRNPLLEVKLFHAAVQGDNAPDELIQALETADKGDFDAILLTRGGGSLEDLWAFNHEGLAHTLFTLQTPVISAVGHERDYTIADYVADVRAATPTAGAEMLSPDLQTSRMQLRQHNQRLVHLVRWQVQTASQRVDQLVTRLFRAHPQRKSTHFRRIVQQRQHQLQNQIRHQLNHNRLFLKQVEQRILQQHPLHQLAARKNSLNHQVRAATASIQVITRQQRQKLQQIAQRLFRRQPNPQAIQHRLQTLQQQLHQAWDRQQQTRQHHVQQHNTALQKLSPLSVLERGYSITMDAKTGTLITAASQVQPGQGLRTRLKSGEVLSTTEKSHPE